MDAPILAAFINLSAVTMFNVGGQLVYYFRNLVINLTGVMVPVFAQFHATQNKKAIRHAYFFTSKLCTALSLLVGGAVMVFGKDFINLWMGPAYVQAYAVLLVLMIPTILYVSQQPALAVIYGLGEMGILAKVSILVALVNIVMCIGLVGPLGMVGVALGIGIPMIFFSMFLVAFTVRLVQATVTDYLREVMGVFLVGGAMQCLSWYIVASLHIASYGDLILSFLAIYPAQVVAILFLTFSTSEIQQIRETSLHALGFGGKA
jgi:O-antigen/teichoic acid export membrane protein